MFDIERYLNPHKTLVIVCDQWGDTGKGKFSHLFSPHYEVFGRGQGGPNAGHTVNIGGNEFILHLIPTGILHNDPNKIIVLGNDMVLDFEILSNEMSDLQKVGVTHFNLMISKDAWVIMPYHIEQDKKNNESQAKGGIGSTGKGIQPCYTDAVARRGIKVRDLYNKDVLKKKINKVKPFYPGQKINTEQIISYLSPLAEEFEPYVCNTVNRMHEFVRQGKRILIEGSQGYLLNYKTGTYPYVTSSDCSFNGTVAGLGIYGPQVDLCLGIVKFPFMTRVGGGPFPTELGGIESEKYCAKGLEHDIFYEVKEYLGMDLPIQNIRRLQAEGKSDEVTKYKQQVIRYIKNNRDKVLRLCNSGNPFLQGVGFRLLALEYGATTSRPRRPGFTDMLAAKYAIGANGPKVILTKADCLAGVEEFKLCRGYKLNGKLVSEFDSDPDFLSQVEPDYISFPGYGDISDIRYEDDIPCELGDAMDELARLTGAEIEMLSVGPEADQTILIDN